MNSLLPTYSKDINTPLLALTTCSLNLQGDCDLAGRITTVNYLNAWKHPAPSKCKSDMSVVSDVIISKDRLGMDNAVCMDQKKRKI